MSGQRVRTLRVGLGEMAILLLFICFALVGGFDGAWIRQSPLSREIAGNLMKVSRCTGCLSDAYQRIAKADTSISRAHLGAEALPHTAPGKSAPDIARAAVAVEIAYDRCRHVTKVFSNTFYLGSSLLPVRSRRHAWAMYAWCRRTDDLVDSPSAAADPSALVADLDSWEQRLDNIWKGHPLDLFDLALADTVRCVPQLEVEPFRDMIRGMAMDIPVVGVNRYESFEDLYRYCYRVAGTVGVMMLPLLALAGTDATAGPLAPETREAAVALGIALQLTNILRDVGEDLDRGRIYLPLDELRAFGVSEQDLAARQVTPRYRDLIAFQIARASDYYRRAGKGLGLLPLSARFAVQASMDVSQRILKAIERNGYDNFKLRASTNRVEKLALLPAALLRSRWPYPTAVAVAPGS